MKITTIRKKQLLRDFDLMEGEPNFIFVPVSTRHRKAIIKAKAKWEHLEKDKYYSVIFSNKLDTRCIDYLYNHYLCDVDFDDMLECGKDKFMWFLMDSGDYYFIGPSEYLHNRWKVVYENRRVLIEKTKLVSHTKNDLY